MSPVKSGDNLDKDLDQSQEEQYLMYQENLFDIVVNGSRSMFIINVLIDIMISERKVIMTDSLNSFFNSSLDLAESILQFHKAYLNSKEMHLIKEKDNFCLIEYLVKGLMFQLLTSL